MGGPGIPADAKIVFCLIGIAGTFFASLTAKALFVDPDSRNSDIYENEAQLMKLEKAYHENPVRRFFRNMGAGHTTYGIFNNEFKPQ